MNRLRDVVDDDHDWLQATVGTWDVSQRWSLGGLSPAPWVIDQLTSQGLALQKVIVDGVTPTGIAQVANVDSTNGYGDLALMLDPGRKPDVGDGAASFVRLAFASLGLRKLCIAAHDDEMRVPDHLGDLVTYVGSARVHYRRGRDVYVDRHVYEVWNHG